MVYALNDETKRKDLWMDLNRVSLLMIDEPWVVVGDFNVIRNMRETSDSYDGMPSTRAVQDFRDCLDDIGLVDWRPDGTLFTWSNKRRANFLAKKLD